MLPSEIMGMFWQVIALLEIIVFVVIFLIYNYVLCPPISRWFRDAKWKNGIPAFIQDESGKVRLCISNKQLPEGVVHYKGKGWFMIAKRPYTSIEDMPHAERLAFKEAFFAAKKAESKYVKDEDIEEEWKQLRIDINLTEQEQQEIKTTIEKLIQTPILEGFGKQVFFGSTDSIALSNLKTISEVSGEPSVTGTQTAIEKGKIVISYIKTVAHANLRNNRLLAPIMYSKTQLDALATGNRLEGMKMFGADTIKVIVMAIVVIGVVASVGLVVYLLTSGNGSA